MSQAHIKSNNIDTFVQVRTRYLQLNETNYLQVYIISGTQSPAEAMYCAKCTSTT